MKEIIIEFENLTSDELHNLLQLEQKMRIIGGKIVGSGHHFPTMTRNWNIEIQSSKQE